MPQTEPPELVEFYLSPTGVGLINDPGFRVTFTGTRHGMTLRQRAAVLVWLKQHEPAVKILIHGGCIGADWQIDGICAVLGIRRYIFPINIHLKSVPPESYKEHGGQYMVHHPPADDPLKRNHKMVDQGQSLIAAPQTSGEVVRSGTWATIRYARQVGRNVTIFPP